MDTSLRCVFRWAQDHISSIKAHCGRSLPVYLLLFKLWGIFLLFWQAPRPHLPPETLHWSAWVPFDADDIILRRESSLLAVVCLFIVRQKKKQNMTICLNLVLWTQNRMSQQALWSEALTQESYCFLLLWERWRQGNGGVVKEDKHRRVCFYSKLTDLRTIWRNCQLAKLCPVSAQQSPGIVSDVYVLKPSPGFFKGKRS